MTSGYPNIVWVFKDYITKSLISNERPLANILVVEILRKLCLLNYDPKTIFIPINWYNLKVSVSIVMLTIIVFFVKYAHSAMYAVCMTLPVLNKLLISINCISWIKYRVGVIVQIITNIHLFYYLPLRIELTPFFHHFSLNISGVTTKVLSPACLWRVWWSVCPFPVHAFYLTLWNCLCETLWQRMSIHLTLMAHLKQAPSIRMGTVKRLSFWNNFFDQAVSILKRLVKIRGSCSSAMKGFED